MMNRDLEDAVYGVVLELTTVRKSIEKAASIKGVEITITRKVRNCIREGFFYTLGGVICLSLFAIIYSAIMGGI